MGMVWEHCHEVVPLVGVPENPTDCEVEKDQTHLTTQLTWIYWKMTGQNITPVQRQK